MIFRSSRPGLFCKKKTLKNFAKFRGKHLFYRKTSVLESLFYKVAGCRLEACNFIKKRLRHRFPVRISECLRTFYRIPVSTYFWLLICEGSNQIIFSQIRAMILITFFVIKKPLKECNCNKLSHTFISCFYF